MIVGRPIVTISNHSMIETIRTAIFQICTAPGRAHDMTQSLARDFESLDRRAHKSVNFFLRVYASDRAFFSQADTKSTFSGHILL
jgi:hypothetical protein